MNALKMTVRIVLGMVVGLAILFAVFYLFTWGDHSVPATVAHDPSLPHITLDGVIYHAETFGDPSNPVVITIHGGPGSDYRSILSLQALADDYFVVFFDQRGAGLSPRVNPEEITLTSAVADLDSIVDFYGAGEPVNLVGHSWGAMLASAYLGQYPDKIDHVVLAEPGFLTSELAEAWAKATAMRFTPGVIYHFLKTKFESLHVRGPDENASADYFAHNMNLYQGDDHPQAGYRCSGTRPSEAESWRFGASAGEAIKQEAVDTDGNFDIDLTVGVEGFNNTVLFMAGKCQQVIGAEWQTAQMAFFPNAELAVIPDAGHEMFAENPEASLAVVRAYLQAPADE